MLEGIEAVLEASPVMRTYMGGMQDMQLRLALWKQDRPAEQLIPECPYNPKTQEALCYAWRAGALMACAQHIEALLMTEATMQ